MPTNDKPQIGGMRVERLSEYPSGAKRSDTRGKGAFYMISPFGLRRLALRYEEGAADKGARNWEMGFPMSRCVDSTMRHLSQIMAGDRSEDHWAAVAWQAFAAMHFEDCISAGSLPASLDDLPNYGSEESPADPEEFPGSAMLPPTAVYANPELEREARRLDGLPKDYVPEDCLTDKQIAGQMDEFTLSLPSGESIKILGKIVDFERPEDVSADEQILDKFGRKEELDAQQP